MLSKARRLFLLPAVFAAFIVSTMPLSGAGEKKVTVHFFESAVCPACKSAKEFLDGYKSRTDITVIFYEVRNRENNVDSRNLGNIKKINMMLADIDRRNGHKPFIYDDTMKAYTLLIEKDVPCYEKRISQSTVLKKPLPVPLFIIGDRVVAGFQKNLIIRFIEQEKKK
ncbi:MAG TPA: hypothetical protein PK926_03305 [Spirochaetota bacterium]|nr:hypothetical protein [Spirochaetota bacterium]HPI88765.1 hypothetical protein [Spirochaetota bacterium]HPR47160.1 hypothetical protein [Spirochaetota bacterium]